MGYDTSSGSAVGSSVAPRLPREEPSLSGTAGTPILAGIFNRDIVTFGYVGCFETSSLYRPSFFCQFYEKLWLKLVKFYITAKLAWTE